MKDVNPNYSLSNTVLDYKITNTNESNKITNITKLKVNYYLKNKDIDSYSLVKSIEEDHEEGETVTGKLINYTNYKTPSSISIKIIKGVNVIDYYYEKSN